MGFHLFNNLEIRIRGWEDLLEKRTSPCQESFLEAHKSLKLWKVTR